MGKNIKRLSLALLALGLSAPAFADNGPFCVTIPSFQGGFSIGADALYMQPSVPNGSYITVFGTNVGTTTNAVFNNTVKNIDPSYHWGFDVTAGYRIPCTGNDITATWTHLGNNGNDTDTTSQPFAFTNDGRVVATTTAVTSGSLDFNNYDAVDLDVGQTVNFGNAFKFRVFTGARWAQVQENRTVNTTFLLPQTGGVITTAARSSLDDNSKFNGIGPQFGFDGRYCLGYGFGLDANLTTSLLIGKVTADETTATSIIAVPTITAGSVTVNTDVNDKTRVVPALDGSLGLDYTYNFNNCERSSLVVQAGWKVINYWGVTHVDTGTTTSNHANNVAFQGPYAGIKVNL